MKTLVEKLERIDCLLELIVNGKNTTEQKDERLEEYERLFCEVRDIFKKKESKKVAVPEHLTYLSHYLKSEQPQKLEIATIEKGLERLRHYEKFTN